MGIGTPKAPQKPPIWPKWSPKGPQGSQNAAQETPKSGKIETKTNMIGEVEKEAREGTV